MSNHNPLRVVFMGTPDFSVPTLEALIQAGHTVVGVYCQPDKQKGRGKQVQMPPVKVAALEHNLPVYQPVTLRDEQVQAELEALKPDVVVVDMNHPLAGADLTFVGEVIESRPATNEEIQEIVNMMGGGGCSCGCGDCGSDCGDHECGEGCGCH